MLPRVGTDFLLNNQPDARIIKILFCYKTLHVSSIFSAHHQEFSAALLSFMQVFDDRIQAESGYSIMTLLGYGHQKTCMKLTKSRIYSKELLMMGREDARNM